MSSYRRQAVSGSAGDLDSEISNILASLPASIDTAIKVEEAAIRFKVFKRQSQGSVISLT
jgi:hypothetical protein